MEKKIVVIVLCLCIIAFPAIVLGMQSDVPLVHDYQELTKESVGQTFWKYQCIDTMKTSRDKARAWASRTDIDQYIQKEMRAITTIGANCVALDTPYDQEFLPYLKAWVRAARNSNLHIWFRGNFSSWEGWFDYPKGMNEEQLFTETKKFITSNRDLFINGDIFTPAPEGENGGPFNQVEVDEYPSFRKFLLEENKITQEAFSKINVSVETNWLSMNGGLAKRMFDQDTLDGLGKVATLDHYIKTAPEMGEYIQYFKNNFGAKTIIGEFGAPIPDITGPMDDDQQAHFIDQLFDQLYRNRADIEGVNYWILTDGSTQLVSTDFTPRKAAAVVEKYYKPTLISGKVEDTFGQPISNATLEIGSTIIHSDKQGEYEFLIPSQDNRLTISKEGFISRELNFAIAHTQRINLITVLEPRNRDLQYTIRYKLESLQKKFLR